MTLLWFHLKYISELLIQIRDKSKLRFFFVVVVVLRLLPGWCFVFKSGIVLGFFMINFWFWFKSSDLICVTPVIIHIILIWVTSLIKTCDADSRFLLLSSLCSFLTFPRSGSFHPTLSQVWPAGGDTPTTVKVFRGVAASEVTNSTSPPLMCYSPTSRFPQGHTCHSSHTYRRLCFDNSLKLSPFVLLKYLCNVTEIHFRKPHPATASTAASHPPIPDDTDDMSIRAVTHI